MKILLSSRVRGFLLCFILICLMVIPYPTRIFAENSTKEGIDAVLIIDASGSMRFSDSSRIALEATRLFVDILETTHSRVGVIAFTDTLQAVIPLTPLDDPVAKDFLKSKISSFRYNGYTDIGLALKEATRMITEDTNEKNTPMILLLTDGVIEMNPLQRNRTEAMSHNDVNTSLETLDGQVPVYTIGLNHNNSIDLNFLQRIADATSARTYLAEESAMLPQIFNEILADHIRASLYEAAAFIADGSNYNDVPIPIQKAGVTETNIILLSNAPLADVKLIDPLGAEIAFDGIQSTLNKSTNYTLVKILQPEEGQWTLQAKGSRNDAIKVNLLHSYSADYNVGNLLEVAISVSQEEQSGVLYDSQKTLQITGTLVSSDPAQSNYNFYEKATATLRVYDNAMALIETLPMEYAGTSFTLAYLPKNADEVKLAIQVEHPDYTKSSVLATLVFEQTEPTAPPPTPTPAPTPTVTPESPEATVAPQTNEPGEADKLNFFVSLIKIPWVWLAAACLLIGLLLIIPLTRRKKSSKLFEGYLEIRAMTGNGIYTQTETPDLSACTGRITLEEFLAGNLKNIGVTVLQIPLNLDGIWIAPGRKKGRPVIKVLNKAPCEIVNDDGIILVHKKTIWRAGQRLTFSNPDAEDMAKLEIIYRTET